MAMAPPSPHVNKKDSNVNEGIPRNDQIPQPLPPYQKPEEPQNDHKLNPKSNESNVNKRDQGIPSHKPLPQEFFDCIHQEQPHLSLQYPTRNDIHEGINYHPETNHSTVYTPQTTHDVRGEIRNFLVGGTILDIATRTKRMPTLWLASANGMLLTS